MQSIELQVVDQVLIVAQENVEVVVGKRSVFLYAGNNPVGIALQAWPVSDGDLVFRVIKGEVFAVIHDELEYELLFLHSSQRDPEYLKNFLQHREWQLNAPDTLLPN